MVILVILDLSKICSNNLLPKYFVLEDLSPKPSPGVGGALTRMTFPLSRRERGTEGERPLNQTKLNP
jgi:hypothetical protein